jgi:hypothetical protein
MTWGSMAVQLGLGAGLASSENVIGCPSGCLRVSNVCERSLWSVFENFGTTRSERGYMQRGKCSHTISKGGT